MLFISEYSSFEAAIKQLSFYGSCNREGKTKSDSLEGGIRKEKINVEIEKTSVANLKDVTFALSTPGNPQTSVLLLLKQSASLRLAEAQMPFWSFPNLALFIVWSMGIVKVGRRLKVDRTKCFHK